MQITYFPVKRKQTRKNVLIIEIIFYPVKKTKDLLLSINLCGIQQYR